MGLPTERNREQEPGYCLSCLRNFAGRRFRDKTRAAVSRKLFKHTRQNTQVHRGVLKAAAGSEKDKYIYLSSMSFKSLLLPNSKSTCSQTSKEKRISDVRSENWEHISIFPQQKPCSSFTVRGK